MPGLTRRARRAGTASLARGCSTILTSADKPKPVWPFAAGVEMTIHGAEFNRIEPRRLHSMHFLIERHGAFRGVDPFLDHFPLWVDRDPGVLMYACLSVGFVPFQVEDTVLLAPRSPVALPELGFGILRVTHVEHKASAAPQVLAHTVDDIVVKKGVLNCRIS